MRHLVARHGEEGGVLVVDRRRDHGRTRHRRQLRSPDPARHDDDLRVQLDGVTPKGIHRRRGVDLRHEARRVTGRAARQLVLLDEHHVPPSRFREVVRDTRAGDATPDDDGLGTLHSAVKRYSGRGCCFVSGRRKRSRAPATAATPPSWIAPPRPVVPERRATASGPKLPPTAAITAITASAVARARVGNSSPDHAPNTGVPALAKALHSTLPTKKPMDPVAKLRLVAAAVDTVSATAGPRRPNRSVR